MRTVSQAISDAEQSSSVQPYVEVTLSQRDYYKVLSTNDTDADLMVQSVQEADGIYGSKLMDLRANNGLLLPVSAIVNLADPDKTLFDQTLTGACVLVKWGYKGYTNDSGAKIVLDPPETVTSSPYYVILKRNIHNPRRPEVELYCISLWSLLGISILPGVSFGDLFTTEDSIKDEVGYIMEPFIDLDTLYKVFPTSYISDETDAVSQDYDIDSTQALTDDLLTYTFPTIPRVKDTDMLTVNITVSASSGVDSLGDDISSSTTTKIIVKAGSTTILTITPTLEDMLTTGRKTYRRTLTGHTGVDADQALTIEFGPFSDSLFETAPDFPDGVTTTVSEVSINRWLTYSALDSLLVQDTSLKGTPVIEEVFNVPASQVLKTLLGYSSSYIRLREFDFELALRPHIIDAVSG